jgi:homoserine trans-succinylase
MLIQGGSMNATEGVWLSISDYSRYKNVSVSTIRRHIKNNILKHKEENGKYFIYVPSSDRLKIREDEELLKIRLEAELLRTKLKQLREENNELRMLVEIYEKQGSKVQPVMKDTPPDLPELPL